jgi:DNA-binding NarL/FixJ family response regulator
MSEPIRVVLVDDQELVRTGFRLVLRGRAGIEVVGEAGDGAAALAVLDAVAADVVVMDVRMPGMDGIAACRAIRARGGPRVLVLTTFDLDEYAYAAIKAGAGGFLLKDSGPDQLIAAIRAVHAGDAVVAPSTTRRLLDRFARHLPADPTSGLDRLTPREREVLVQMAGALSNAEIAELLVLSEATVRTHVNRILAKLEVRDRVQAVVLAYESGLVSPTQRG